jgi:23S rRNA maturation-related 3'-5' exoribonuclease YhaM
LAGVLKENEGFLQLELQRNSHEISARVYEEHKQCPFKTTEE